MFILSLICLILGILLLIVSVVLFFKLDVKNAYLFIHNKRTNRTNVSSSRKRPRTTTKKSKGKVKDNVRSKFGGTSGKLFGNNNESVKSSHSPWQNMSNNTKKTNQIITEDSEDPTGILVEHSEMDTGVLQEESELPTGVLQEDSEGVTDILSDAEGSESPTGILDDDNTESPTGILDDGAEGNTGILDAGEDVNVDEDSSDSSYKFDIVKNEVVVHTDEVIK